MARAALHDKAFSTECWSCRGCIPSPIYVRNYPCMKAKMSEILVCCAQIKFPYFLQLTFSLSLSLSLSTSLPPCSQDHSTQDLLCSWCTCCSCYYHYCCCCYSSGKNKKITSDYIFVRLTIKMLPILWNTIQKLLCLYKEYCSAYYVIFNL